MDNKNQVQEKSVKPLLVASITGHGKVSDANQDVDKLYGYLYQHNLQDKIAGPTMALFYSEHGGKYTVAVPLKESFPETNFVKIIKLPAIKCLFLMSTKPKLDTSFTKIKNYEKRHGISWQFPVREIYYPTKAKDKYITEIQVPIPNSV